MAFDLIGGKTSNEALDNRAGATEQARASGGKQSPLTTDKAKAAIGNKSKIQEKGSIDLSGAKDLNFGTDFSANKGTVTITNTSTNNAAGAVEIASTFADTVKSLAAQRPASPSNYTGPSTAELSSQNKPADADTKASDTASSDVWYKRPVVIAGFAVAVVVLWLWKK